MKRSIKALRKRAWKLFSEYVRRKEKGICFSCRIKKDWRFQHAGHYLHRDCLDFEEKNVHCQCVKCNSFLGGNLVEYAVRLEKEYGTGILQELKEKSYKIKVWKVKELEGLIEKYKQKLNEIE